MDYSNWMKEIGDHTLLSEMTIPGTHDSGTFTLPLPDPILSPVVTPFAKTQSKNFTEQFNSGCRFLDIRCRHINDSFAIHHDVVYLQMNFNDVLKDCIAFLDKHPSECLLMLVSDAHATAENNKLSFTDTFLNYYRQNPSVWHTDLPIPAMGEVRGKICLLRGHTFSWDPRDQKSNPAMGLHFNMWEKASGSCPLHSGQELRYENLAGLAKYYPGEIDTKWNVVRENIEKCQRDDDKNHFYCTFSSGYAGLITPELMAEGVNKYMREQLRYDGRRMGLVVGDFVDASYTHPLIDNNFA